MDSATIFAQLRDALAVLYPKKEDARIVVAVAGLNSTNIAFNASAQTNFHNGKLSTQRDSHINSSISII